MSYSRGIKAYHQWGDAANTTHHQVSLSSPQTKDGSSMSPRVTSLQMHNTTVVNLAVAGILHPLNIGGSQSFTPPPCCHNISLVLLIMYRVYLFPFAYRY
ncbi:hypothetical protein MtrunA17_Chr4g0006141 [Medicago truncatula]|uniref:Uncharacterized protein n=1 Tax=Medicago truncatula TaxID=3880 RepID=G7JN18_MEDTR|nr:hypothetical protein MTR_4g015500 [Medicago truncatula]RHN58787.1 hypothetical protein MtrunA17_Chr4g0006141 [Medicago truncatula]